jgi:mRNA interferase YafQ
MIKKVHYTSQFKKDFKQCKKRGYDMQQLVDVMKLLEEGKKLPAKNKGHILKGNYGESKECHIGPDWLLIYQLFDNDITFVRTGSHSDLFI